MAESLEPRRGGRPWAALRGDSQELNEIAEALRHWLRDAGVTVAVLHHRLTPDHFGDGVVPARRKLYDLCAGRNLTWEFVEAVADVCTPDDAPAQQRKLKRARELWDAARARPTPVGQQRTPPARELLETKDQVIAAYRQIERLRQAQADSEQARVRAEQLVTVLFTMLGQLFAKIGDLTQDRNQLLAERSPDRKTLTVVESRLREAEGHRTETEDALRRAQRERDEALRVADEARRVAGRLQDELDRLRGDHGDTATVGPPDSADADRDGPAATGLPDAPHPDEVFLHDYADALRKARTVLDTGSHTLQAAEEQIAEVDADLSAHAEGGIPGRGLYGTTTDNSVTGTDNPMTGTDNAMTGTNNSMTGEDLEFEDRYRTYLSRRYADLTIFGADLTQDAHARWPLDRTYLSLRAAGAAPGSVERVEQALAGRQRTVVMGDAGSGKTTLVQWLAINAARGSLPDMLAPLNGTVPFVLPLRGMVRRGSLPRPEELLTAVGCPLAGEQPEGWALRVFEHGRALVLVDGVDEVPQEYRARTREWLEALLAAHPRGCYVVTTRVLSVPEGWLDGVGFRHLTLLPLGTDDVAAFVSRWHAAVRSEAGGEKRQFLDAMEQNVLEALRRDANLAALATSPLLCALICAMNRDRRGHLPRSVMSLYDAALTMLIERRDAERGIGAVEGVRMTGQESVQLLQALAYWLVRNDRSATDLSTAAQVLRRVLVAMPNLAGECDADQALSHLVARSGVLRQPAADRVEFVHRTFQDYLSARAAVESSDFGLLTATAHQPEWENVLRMATGHARPHERAQLLRSLVDRGDQVERHRERLHRLAASCLEYAVELSPEVLEMIRRRMPEGDA